MREEFLGLEELHRVRRDYRQLEPAGERERTLNVLFCVGRAGALQLDIEALRKQLSPFPRQPLGLRGIVLHERAAYVPGLGARKREQAVHGVGSEPLFPDLGAAAHLVLQPGPGKQLATAAENPAIAAQQQQARRLVALGFIADPDIAADEGFTPCARAAL